MASVSGTELIETLPFAADFFIAEDVDGVTGLYQTYKYYQGRDTYNELMMIVTLTYDALGNVLTAKYVNQQ